MKNIRTDLLAAALVGATMTAIAFTTDGQSRAETAIAASAPAAAVPLVGGRTDSYAAVVDRVAPAVVTIRSVHAVPAVYDLPYSGQRRSPNAPPHARGAEALGSGVLVSSDGYILTNNHVIDGGTDITVELRDRRTFTARVVGTDAPSDLALLRIAGSGFPALALGNSDQVRVGDVVLAFGNPLGIGQTVTMGIISAKGRATGLGDGGYEDFLQTDAPINQGNSGGPLVNVRGELVGINSQILSPTGGNIGVGFSIPANMAKNVMQSLRADGRVHRGMIGVTVKTVTADEARALQLDAVAGALVNSVEPDGPAADAGVRPGDVITAFNGTRIDDSNELRNLVAQSRPGSSAALTIVRDGRSRGLTATLDELPATTLRRTSR